MDDVIYFSAVNINYLLYTCYFYIYFQQGKLFKGLFVYLLNKKNSSLGNGVKLLLVSFSLC